VEEWSLTRSQCQCVGGYQLPVGVGPILKKKKKIKGAKAILAMAFGAATPTFWPREPFVLLQYNPSRTLSIVRVRVKVVVTVVVVLSVAH